MSNLAYIVSQIAVLGTVGLSFPATSTEMFLLLVVIAVWAAIIIFVANQTSKSDALTRTQKIAWGLGAVVLAPLAIVLYFVLKPGRS